MAGSPIPRRLFVFSHPRTASNLFCKLFSEHPDIQYLQNPFVFARFFGPDAQAVLEGEFDESLKGMKDMLGHLTYQYCLDKMESEISDVEAKVCLEYSDVQQLIRNLIGQDPNVQRT